MQKEREREHGDKSREAKIAFSLTQAAKQHLHCAPRAGKLGVDAMAGAVEMAIHRHAVHKTWGVRVSAHLSCKAFVSKVPPVPELELVATWIPSCWS